MFASLALLSLLKTGAGVKTPLVRTAMFHAPEDIPQERKPAIVRAGLDRPDTSKGLTFYFGEAL